MSTDFLDWLSEQLLDNEMRVGFGAEKIKTALALALLDARESRGLSQSQLAELCGVSQAYISKLESGEANPTIGKIGSIFAAMWMKPSIGFGPLMPERSGTPIIRTQRPSRSSGDCIPIKRRPCQSAPLLMVDRVHKL